jgi:hypothetical protein
MYSFIFLLIIVIPPLILITEHYILLLRDDALFQIKAMGGDRIRTQSHSNIHALRKSRKRVEPLDSFQAIDHIYYINMDKRTDKRDFMESWLKPFSTQYSIPYQRISARTGFQNQCRGVSSRDKKRCLAGKGLLNSNLRIMNKFNTTGYTLVLEDDYQITNYNRLLNFVKKVPEDWDIIRFDCWTDTQSLDPEDEFPLFEFGYRTITPPNGTHFCGGTHAALWRSDRLPTLRKIWKFPKAPYLDIDCLLSDSDIHSYCVQANVGNLVKSLTSDIGRPKIG